MDPKLSLVLEEYKALREAVLNNFRLQLQIYAIYASGLLVFYGLVFEHKVYDIIMIIPIFSLALFFRVNWHEAITRRVSEYIFEIEEKKLMKLVGTIEKESNKSINSSQLCVGWQHYWKEIDKFPGWPKYWEYSAKMLFVLFSVVPTIIFSLYNIIVPLSEKKSGLNSYLLAILILINSLIGCYMWYRINNIFPKRNK